MANSNKNADNVERFLNEEMSPEEHARFLEEMENDPELEKEVRTQKLEKEAIDLLFEEEYKEKITKWRKEAEQGDERIHHATSTPKPNLFHRYRRLIKPLITAAALLFLICAGLYFWTSSNYSDEAILADNFYNPSQNLEKITLRGGGQISNDVIREFETAKNEILAGQHHQAIERLDSLSLSNSKVQYLLALACYGKKDYSKAISLFKNLTKKGDSFEYEAKLYLMYTYLANNQTEDEAFRTLLEQIINEDYYPGKVRENATTIKKDLNSFSRKVFKFFN